MKRPKSGYIGMAMALGFTITFLLSQNAQTQASVSAAANGSTMVYLPVVMKGLPSIIPETTIVLTEETTQYLASVSPDGSMFTFSQNTSELAALDPGDVMVGDTSEAAPYGFLREVTSVSSSGGQVVVNTVPTTLEDAIQQGAISFSKQLTPADIESVTARPGVTLLNIGAPTIDDSFYFDINDVVLYDDDGNPDTPYDQIKVNGSLELAPGFDFDITLQDWILQDMEVVFNVEETVELEFEIEVEVLSLELSYEIARLYFGTLTVFVGPVPVVFVIEMPIYLRGDGDVSVGITTSVTQQANLSAGLRYEQGDWSPIANLNNDFSWDPPTLSADADFKGYIDPPLNLLLYGVTGIFIAADPYLELKADIFADPWWELYGGIEATVGVKIEVLGRSLGDHTEVVIGYRILLAQAPLATGTTSRVSVASDGTQGNNDSVYSAISADGRYVAFPSHASNLVSDDTNGASDVFVHDRQTGQTSRVSIASNGTQGNGYSYGAAISADGRYVAFNSYASNLVPDDTNGEPDVFVHDRHAGQTSRVSVASDGTQGNDGSYANDISADGRYVAFFSSASNLVTDDTNGTEDIFVHDRQTGQTSRVSVSSDGIQGNNISWDPVISADSRYVAFESDASNLVPGDTNGYTDIFVHDQQTGQTSRVSVASDGTQGNDSISSGVPPAISADGRYVAFHSYASNLVPDDTNGYPDIFVHDRQTGQTSRVSVASDGTQGNGYSYVAAISADGRYVAFDSCSSNLVSGDTNGRYDVFVHDRQTGQTSRVSVTSGGTQGNFGVRPDISADGRYVAFESSASNLVPGDTNGAWDVFVHDRGE